MKDLRLELAQYISETLKQVGARQLYDKDFSKLKVQIWEMSNTQLSKQKLIDNIRTLIRKIVKPSDKPSVVNYLAERYTECAKRVLAIKDDLYCIITNVCDSNGKVINALVDSYVHARNRREARHKYCVGTPDRTRYQIVDVAKVIGYKVQDKQGLILSV